MVKVYLCKHCRHRFSSDNAAKRHIREYHKATEADKTCKFCGKIYKTMQVVRNHIEKVCPMNPNKKAKPVQIDVKCEDCGRQLKKNTMAAHKSRCHKGVVMCPRCDKTTSTKYLMRLHLEKLHKVIILLT